MLYNYVTGIDEQQPHLTSDEDAYQFLPQGIQGSVSRALYRRRRTEHHEGIEAALSHVLGLYAASAHNTQTK